MAQRFSVDAIFRAIDQISNPVRRMSSRVGRSAARMEKSFGKVNRTMAQIGGAGRRIGAGVLAGTAVAGAGLAKIITTGAEVEQTLVNAGSKFQVPIRRGTKEFEALAAAASEVAGRTEFSTKQAAAALEFMAKANENANVSMASLATFADLASVAQVDLAVAADFASDSIGPLGLATDDLTKKSAAYRKTADLMAKTANVANLGFEELFESIKSGAGGFRTAGQETEQFLASVAVLAANAIKGSKAGKDLSRIMARITDSSTKAQGALKKLRVDFQKNGKILDFVDIMADLKVKLDKVSEVKRTQALSDIFGKNSKEAGIKILENIAKVREFEKRITEASGFTAETAAISRNTALGKIKTFWSTVEGIVVSVFFVIREDVEKIVTAMTDWARANKDVITKGFLDGLAFMRDNFSQILSIGKRLAILAVVFTALGQVLTTVQATLAITTTVMTLLGTATTITALSLGLIVIGVLILIAALVLLVIFWDDIVEVVEKVHDVLVDLAVAAIEVLVEAWKATVKAIGKAIDALVDIFVEGFQFIEDLFDDPVQTLKDAWDGLPRFFEDMWDGIKDIFSSAMDGLSSSFEEFGQTINTLTGLDFFGNVTVQTDLATPEGVGEPRPDFGDVFGGFAATSSPGDFSPQIIDTTSASIAETVSESIRSMTLDINLKDPGGAVESIEQGTLDESVTVTSSGDL